MARSDGFGWLVGGAYGIVTRAALTAGLHRSGAGLGPADRVTLSRAVLVGAVAALAAGSFVRPVPVAVPVVIAAVALVLDAVDGRVARHTGTASALGVRFDMETDAFLILVLSVYVARPVGAWVLAIGVVPWLGGPLAGQLATRVPPTALRGEREGAQG